MSCSAAAAAASAAATRIFSARVGPRGGCRAAAAAAAEAPSCLFVGPIGTASKERLEALYNQARDAYYSGKPLIVDDMFDKVELKLRLYGSKSVVKYPRCSLRRQSTYADAEEDPSQVFALASVWILLLSFGISAFLLPIIYTIGLAFKEAFDLRDLFNIGESSFELRRIMNGIILIGFGCSIGYPVAAASGLICWYLNNHIQH